MTHAVQSSLVSAIGASSIQMESDLMRQEQTVVWSYGSSIALRTIAQYVFMYRRTDPVEQYTYWDGYVQVHPTTIDFLYGDGRVMFVNNKITAFHSSGVPGKKYIELLISWLESFYDQMHSSQSQAMKDTVKARAMSDDFLTSRLATAVNATSLPRGMRDNVFYHQAGDNRTRVSETKVNKLSFGTWITPDDIKVLQIDDDLVLSVKGTSDRVTVPGWFKGISNVSDVVFENGTTLSTARIRELAVLSEPEIESTPVAVDSRTAGTKERDTLVGRDGANEMFVGLEGDDTIIGKGGRKVYYYRIGDGHDTLILSKKLEEDRNALRFDMAITSKDLQVSRSGEDLVIGVKDGSIKIEEWYKDTASRRLDRVEFITGEVWDSRDLEKLASGKELSTREYYIDMGNAKFEELLGSANPEVQPEDTPESAETPSGGGCNAGVSVMCGLVAIVVAITNRSKIRQ
jgi:hypothetical protein